MKRLFRKTRKDKTVHQYLVLKRSVDVWERHVFYFNYFEVGKLINTSIKITRKILLLKHRRGQASSPVQA